MSPVPTFLKPCVPVIVGRISKRPALVIVGAVPVVVANWSWYAEGEASRPTICTRPELVVRLPRVMLLVSAAVPATVTDAVLFAPPATNPPDQAAVLPHVDEPTSVHVPLCVCAYTVAGFACAARIAKTATEMVVHRMRSPTRMAPMPIVNLVSLPAMSVTPKQSYGNRSNKRNPPVPVWSESVRNPPRGGNPLLRSPDTSGAKAFSCRFTPALHG